ncbi:MAG: hypothetical protein E6K54_08480 [Gammaproteobacteria bacterium]|nr:MAG: hypothetical protein E6K54_08480 [Gammaproteobacteria bacterium]
MFQKSNVGEAVTLQPGDDSQLNVNNAIQCIVDAAGGRPQGSKGSILNKKQPWYDFECLRMRK